MRLFNRKKSEQPGTDDPRSDGDRYDDGAHGREPAPLQGV
jgi:hypothetical protein